MLLEINRLRGYQQELSGSLEEKQSNGQKLQQAIDIHESDIERMVELKQRVSILQTTVPAAKLVDRIYFHRRILLRLGSTTEFTGNYFRGFVYFEFLAGI